MFRREPPSVMPSLTVRPGSKEDPIFEFAEKERERRIRDADKHRAARAGPAATAIGAPQAAAQRHAWAATVYPQVSEWDEEGAYRREAVAAASDARILRADQESEERRRRQDAIRSSASEIAGASALDPRRNLVARSVDTGEPGNTPVKVEEYLVKIEMKSTKDMKRTKSRGSRKR